jgi:hypothetical protein
MTGTLTYHASVGEKRKTLAQLRAHRKLDQIVQGTYWREENGDSRGCAVGCLTHHPRGGHDQFPDRWGVPVQIAYLMDYIFEALPVDKAKDWPVRIMSAIPVGKDLSGVYDRWCVWVLRRLVVLAGVSAPVVEVMASLFERAVEGDEPTNMEWAQAAEAARAAQAAWAARAARAAEAARAARAAEAAWAAGAARAAEAAEAARAARAAQAAWAAWAAGAARAAEAAEAAWAARAARAAEAAWAAGAAEAAEAAARHDWARAAADELVRLVKTA